MRHFRLAEDCFLVEGERDGVLYDVLGRRILILDAGAHALLRRCEDGQPLLKADIEDPAVVRLLDGLCAAGLGAFYEAAVHVEKVLLHAPVEWRGFALQPPPFRKVDWSISSECDWQCTFCPREESDVWWQACRTCLRRAARQGGDQAWRDPAIVIEQIVALGIGGLHIRGGNPLLGWSRLLAVLTAAADLGPLNVVVSTPGSGRPVVELVELYERFKQFRLNIVLFATDAAASGRTPRRAAQEALLDELAHRGLPFTLTLVLDGPSDPAQAARVRNEMAKRWGTRPSPAEVLSEDALRAGHRFSHVAEKTKPLSRWLTPESFYFRVDKNTCLHGAFEIGVDGVVTPCAAVDEPCGRIEHNDLRRALSGSDLYEHWSRGKQDVTPCATCALRYACADCTAVELRGQELAAAKGAYCSFDPQAGTRAHELDWAQPEFVSVLRMADLQGDTAPCPTTS